MSKFSRWSGRLGTPNQHNASLPRDFWLEDWEKAAIIAFHALYPLEGYRRLAYMMLDADVVAVSPSSVYRVLRAAGKLAPRGGKPSNKGQGFEQPLRSHEHWHIDVSSSQRLRDLLLPVQHPRRLQPVRHGCNPFGCNSRVIVSP